MTFSKFLKVVFALLILFAVAIGLTSIDHPIILKWVTGSARHFGKPIAATVYTNGQVNNRIKVYYTDEPNNYILRLTEYDSSGTWKFLNINLMEKWIGRPIDISINDFDFIAGHLFLTDGVERFSPFQDEKGLNFDPQFPTTDTAIKFNLPPNKLRFDSVRIRLH
jgi:hypothetical protein